MVIQPRNKEVDENKRSDNHFSVGNEVFDARLRRKNPSLNVVCNSSSFFQIFCFRYSVGIEIYYKLAEALQYLLDTSNSYEKY